MDRIVKIKEEDNTESEDLLQMVQRLINVEKKTFSELKEILKEKGIVEKYKKYLNV